MLINAVGYQNKEIKGGEYNMNCSTFVACGKNKANMTFGDIKASREFMFAADNVMTLTTIGRTGDIVTYLTQEEADEYGIEGLKAGWYDLAYVTDSETGWDWSSPIPNEYRYDEKTLPFGTMVIAQGTDGATVNYAGEVIGNNHQFVIVGGVYNMIGNASPVDLTMADIVATRDFMFAADNVMTLTTIGRTGDIMTYLTQEEAAEYGIEGLKAGWYDLAYVTDSETGWDWSSPIPADKCFNALPIPAGYGFIAQGTDGSIIEVPTPLAD